MRVILLTEIIAPYRIPVFNELAKCPQFDFKVLFLNKSQNQRKWPIYLNEIKFNYEILPGLALEGDRVKTTHVNPTIFLKLIKEKFDLLIVGGWHQPAYYVALLYANLLRKKMLLWCESTQKDERSNHSIYHFIKNLFIKNISGAIVPGKASKEYVSSLGIPRNKTWVAPNAVDSKFYEEKSQELRRIKEKIREEKHLPPKIILYVGRLDLEKGVQDLLQAYEKILTEMPEVGLVLCGDGKEKASLQAYCEQNNLRQVLFTGFLNREELSLYYAMADVFVLPSYTEPWGLVVNEAMNCGLPILCSRNVGAAEDLVLEGQNGFMFLPGDVSTLQKRLSELLTDEQKRKSFGLKSREIINAFSPKECAEGFIKAIREA